MSAPVGRGVENSAPVGNLRNEPQPVLAQAIGKPLAVGMLEC